MPVVAIRLVTKVLVANVLVAKCLPSSKSPVTSSGIVWGKFTANVQVSTTKYCAGIRKGRPFELPQHPQALKLVKYSKGDPFG